MSEIIITGLMDRSGLRSAGRNVGSLRAISGCKKIPGLSTGKWSESRKQACELMFDYLIDERGLSPEEAHFLISASVDVTYGGPAGVSVASIPLNVFD